MSVLDIAEQLDGSEFDEDDMFAGLDDSYNDEEWRPNTRNSSSSSDIDVAMMNNSNSNCSLPPPQGESGDIGPEVRVFMNPPSEERTGYATECDDGK